MADGPLRIKIEAEGPEAEAFRARALSEGFALAEGDGEADLVARPAASPRMPGLVLARPREDEAFPARRSLSRRELEILDYLADGWSNAEIASALRLKVRTVRFHLESVYGKLGVSRRGEAVREALRLGLLRFDF
jgi:ATP/maltotriose-dependent transcriptional regulator MalT